VTVIVIGVGTVRE
ncbi:hypothetical protein A2U01_0038792, partial [Trifolium medium]|nr:hypothetical protein [Trifolium medium]